MHHRTYIYPERTWKNSCTHVKIRMDFSLAKKVSESVRPSSLLGWSGSNRCFLCCQGASRFSISMGSMHSCVVAAIVFAVTISGELPNRFSQSIMLSGTTAPRPLQIDCLRRSGAFIGIRGVSQLIPRVLTSSWDG